MRVAYSAIIVAAKYITDGWLMEVCARLNMVVVKLHEETVDIEVDDIDFKIMPHVKNYLKWDGYIVSDVDSTISYSRAGWQIKHA